MYLDKDKQVNDLTNTNCQAESSSVGKEKSK
jgi:hypothetical protein